MNIFIFSYEDLGELGRWERESKVIPSTGNTSFYEIKFLTVLYDIIKIWRTTYLHRAAKDGENDLAIMWTPITKIKPLCFSCLFSALSDPNVIMQFLMFVNFY
uniref:Uncharacterized protein n=1 Tax=Sus scrofa TaxID=9823 RepID=A0A4X1UJW1_PIG